MIDKGAMNLFGDRFRKLWIFMHRIFVSSLCDKFANDISYFGRHR